LQGRLFCCLALKKYGIKLLSYSPAKSSENTTPQNHRFLEALNVPLDNIQMLWLEADFQDQIMDTTAAL
jgi:hypothetical protein